ncbi:hypothetical protein FRC17_009954, partial [Serendipita sp. 399]
IDQLGDIVTLTSEDTTTDGNRSSPVILFAKKSLPNTTHTIALKNLRNPIDGIVGQLIVDAFLFTADVSPRGNNNTGGNASSSSASSRRLMAGIIAICITLGLCLVLASLFYLLWRRRRRGPNEKGRRGGFLQTILPTVSSPSPSAPSPTIIAASRNDDGGVGGGGDPSRSPLAVLTSVVGRSVRAAVPEWKRPRQWTWREEKRRDSGVMETGPMMVERDPRERWENEAKKPPVELELPIHAKLATAHRPLSLSRFRPQPRFPTKPKPTRNDENTTADTSDAGVTDPMKTTSSFSSRLASAAAGLSRKRSKASRKSRRSSVLSTSPPLPPLPSSVSISNVNPNTNHTYNVGVPIITITSPTTTPTIPTTASTYSTFSQSNSIEGSLVRKSDPYAAYAAIYAPYFGTEKEEEVGRRGSVRRNRPSGNGTSGGASVTGDNSISQLSHTFRERTGVALRDSVVLPGVLEMPPFSMPSRPASYALYSAAVAAMPPLPPPSLPPPPRPISSSTRILPTPSISTAPSNATTNNNTTTILNPSSSSRAPPSSFNPKVLQMGEQEGNGNDADGGNRTGVKGKRTLSDKIKRGTLPLVPSLLEEEVEGVEERQQQERGRRSSISSMSSSSSKRSAVSSVLSILSRRSSSASLVSKRFSNATTTTKNSKGNGSIGSSSKKRISSVLKKRRPGSASRNGSGGGPSGSGPGADEIDEKMTSLMPNFSSRSSLSLSQGGQASSSSSVARLRSQIRLPPTLPLRVQPSTQRPSIDSPVQVNQDGNELDDNVRVGAVDDVSSLPGNLMVQSPVSLPINTDASSSLLPLKSDNSLLSPPNEKPDSPIVAHEIVESPATYNHEEPVDMLPYLAEGSTGEGTRSESLQRRSTTTSSGRDHGRSSVFMSMLTLQSSDASNGHTDSPMRRTNSSSNPHASSNRNTRMSMKTARSSLVSKTARSSVMSNAPTPSVSEFPMPPFITMDSDSMPTFDFSRMTMSEHPTSGSGSGNGDGGGSMSNLNNNADMTRSSTGTGSGSGGGNLTGSGTGAFTDLVASTPSSSSGSFRKSIPIRFAGVSGGIGSSAITGATPPSAYPFAYKAPARPKRNRALGATLLGLDVPASVQSRAPIVRRGSSRSSRGTGSSKSPKRRNKLPIRGDPIPMRAGRVGSSGMENNLSSSGTSSTTFFMPPPPPSSNDHGSQLDLPSRGPSRMTMTSVITSTTDEEFAHGEVQLLVARREYPPSIPDVPTRAVPPGTDDSMSISVDGSRPISGTTSEGKWEIIFPGLPPGMTPILTCEGNGSHRLGGPPLAAVPVSARTDAFERATMMEMSPTLSNRIGGGGGAALSRDPSFGAISVGNMRLDATAGLPWSPNFDWPASPTSFTNFSSVRRPSLPFSSSGHLFGNGNVPFSSSGHLVGGDNAPDAAGIPRGEGDHDERQNRPNVPFDSLQSLNWKDLIGPRSGPQVDPIDTDRRSNVRQSTYSVASTFFGGGKSQVEESPSSLTPASPSVIPPVPPIPTRFSRSSALVVDSPRRTVAPLNMNFRPSWNNRTFTPRSPGTPQQQQQPQMLPSAARPIGNLNDVFATSWNSGSTTARYSGGSVAGRILVPKATTESSSRSEQGTPVRSFPQRGVPFP